MPYGRYFFDQDDKREALTEKIKPYLLIVRFLSTQSDINIYYSLLFEEVNLIFLIFEFIGKMSIIQKR